MMTQAGLWTGAGIAVLAAVLSGVADWRRDRRRDLDRIGWMPWAAVQIVFLFAAAILAILAMRS